MQFILIFLGIIIFQMTLVFLQWLFFKRTEFLWYIVYLLTIFCYTYIYYEKSIGYTHLFYPNYFNQFVILRVIGFFTLGSYVVFGRAFIELDRLYPEMKKIVNSLQYIVLFSIVIFLTTTIFSQNFILLENLSFGLYALMFLYSSVMNLILIKKKIVLNNFIIIGSIFAIVGGSTQGIMETINIRNGKPLFVHYQTLAWGCVIEYICLNIGFLYKSKMIQMQEIEAKEDSIRLLQQNETISTRLNNLQNELSMDLHDEIGSSLSSIKVYSELARQELKSKSNQSELLIQKITEQAEAIMEQISSVIFLLKNYHTGNAISTRIQQMSENLLLPKRIKTTFEFGEDSLITKKSTIELKHILLIIKEAFNNIAKYSEASECKFKLTKRDDHIQISISDNGKGFDIHATKTGNGIQNIRTRTKFLDGTCSINSIIDKGTVINILIPISSIR